MFSSEASYSLEEKSDTRGGKNRFADISLNQWMALTPPQLVKEHLHVDDAMIRALHKEKSPIVTYKR